MTRALYLLFALALVGNVSAQDQNIYQKGFLTKKESLESLQVPDGYKLQLVLSDPIIKEPVAVAWDGNGVMYVVEMRTYMQDADATEEQTPRSRISRHEDTNGDGVYDKHSIFIDNMLLPRMVLPLDDRVMVGITNTLDLWNYRDTDGDGVADEKIKIFKGGKRGGNMEHQPSGLVWGLDNWIYLTYQSVRYRFTDGKLITERLPNGGGQWGLTQDDDGRFYYSAAGGEKPAFYFQQPMQYGALNLPGQLSPDFTKVYPIAPVPDVQGGKRRIGETGGLNYFTGCAGQEVFRGDALPADLYGDLIIPEPVGRLIRRAKITRSGGKTVISNATPGTEFMRTRDVNFRPVQAKTGPDGCLYIVDMHRGIIQQGNWTRPGSYLRGIIDKWGLHKNIGKGRIYRLVHKDHKPGPRPNMKKESTVDLVKHLTHKNSWWRDTAKKLIILRKDRNTAIPSLEKLALDTAQSFQTRTSAMWTLEGISSVKPSVLAQLLADKDSHVLTSALRISEPFLKAKDTSVTKAVRKLSETTDADVALQLYNSLHYAGRQSDTTAATEFANIQSTLISKNSELAPLHFIHEKAKNKMSQAQRQATMKLKNAKLANSMARGEAIYGQLCHTCHGEDGKGQLMAGDTKGSKLAPSLIGSPRVNGTGEALLRVLLDGMQGPLDGKTYPGLMMPMKSNNDQWIADVATYIRNSFSNKGSMITPRAVASVRKATASRTAPWTQAELHKIEAPMLTNRHQWKLSASHNNKGCQSAIDGNASSRYTTNKSMAPGMWFMIELPKSSTITGIKLDSQSSAGDYPRGYKVKFSSDGKTWSQTVKGKGVAAITEIKFPKRTAKFIRITQTGKTRLYWSIHELNLYGTSSSR